MQGYPRKSQVALVDSLKKELHLQHEAVNVKSIIKALEGRESDEFEVDLQHKTKLCLYKELKREVGPEEYLGFVKGIKNWNKKLE